MPEDAKGQPAQRVRFITHRDQRVLLVDCTDCPAEQVGKIADEVPVLVTGEPPRSVLLLADFSGAKFSKDSVEHLKIATVFDRAHLKRAAWVLNENLPKTLLDSIRTFSQREIPIFKTREEALQYLFSQKEGA